MGSPSTASSRVLLPILTPRPACEAIGHRHDQRLELRTGVAVHLEVPSERIAHFGFLHGARNHRYLRDWHGDGPLAATRIGFSNPPPWKSLARTG